MRKRENECCDCGLPCMGSACPNRNVLRLYCDKCGHEASELFDLDGDELCEDCLYKMLPRYESDDEEQCPTCGEYDFLRYLNGEPMCRCCIEDKLRIVDFDD